MKSCYRYRTSVLVGRWRRRPEKALEDAVAAGQALHDSASGVQWQVSGMIQESFCNLSDACGGVYPPPD